MGSDGVRVPSTLIWRESAATGRFTPDLKSLQRLQAAHVRAIPFEGIDPLVGTPVSLDAASVWRKLVESRRGGYCFEQNALFKTALEAIGFKTTGLGARVRWMSPPDSPLGPREHMLIKVDLPEGPFLADVGFGACLDRRAVAARCGAGTSHRDGRFSA